MSDGHHAQPTANSMISLDRLLDGVDVSTERLLVCDYRRDPSAAGRIAAPSIYWTVNGSGILRLAGVASVRFSRRSVVVLPAGLCLQIMPERGQRRSGQFGRSEPVLVAFGQIRATYQGSFGLFDHIREAIVEGLDVHDPIGRAFEDFLEEVAGQRPGAHAMAETLLRRTLILFLRRCWEHGESRLAWLAALEDGRLARAVDAMHERPEHSFTLQELADVAGMSRSVFATRFATALGHPPLDFLKQLRLGRAAQLLTRTELPVKAVAGRVGYASRSSFTRAFVDHYGTGPTAFRFSTHQPQPAAAVA